MKLTIGQKFELFSRSWGKNSSITAHLWPGGVLIYDIERSLGKLRTVGSFGSNSNPLS